MNRITAHKKALYQLRFSPMCKPAGEVANLTQLESHTTRAHAIMLWRIAEGIIDWGPRDVELLYESTLDSISEAFDVFHYPISQIMLDARADVWDRGLAPDHIVAAVERSLVETPGIPTMSPDGKLVLAGEIAQLAENNYETNLDSILEEAGIEANLWMAPTGVLAYVLGAREVARKQALIITEAIQKNGARMVIADGAETAWALMKVYPALGLPLPDDLEIVLLSAALDDSLSPPIRQLGKVFMHDSRPACLIADEFPSHLAILPGYFQDEIIFGQGAVYEAPRSLIDKLGAQRVFGTWTRCLAKSCGADDGLWLTYPEIAVGLAKERLEYAKSLGAQVFVTDSPLCVGFLAEQGLDAIIPTCWLPELLISQT